MNTMSDNTVPVLQAKSVTKEFATSGSALRRGRIAAVDQVSLSLYEKPPQIISLVGESGSGKTTLSRMLLGLTPPTQGEVLYHGKNIFALSKEEFRDYRTHVQPVFQDPYGIYNPFYRIERVLELVIHNFKLAKNKAQARDMVEEALKAVDLRPNDVIGRYPHQLS